LQYFITESIRNAHYGIDLAAKQTSEVLPKFTLIGLIFDESGVLKKGELSVLSQFQWLSLSILIRLTHLLVFCCTNKPFRLSITGDIEL